MITMKQGRQPGPPAKNFWADKEVTCPICTGEFRIENSDKPSHTEAERHPGGKQEAHFPCPTHIERNISAHIPEWKCPGTLRVIVDG